ncbi:nonsense-mediated mRNA decay factor SMG9 isoform X1 [Procambarus clarkii]|uniref:nonsense-mediated mRNA decay factor SMG9 isoform X1 n=1 Tax=Procambarus clarkii TaxID=6728 RepID=UPI001E673736|nr:protein SMG9-like isoform X1 [Procambarus clarkii]
MADVGDKAKNKKKIRKVLMKPDREYETFLSDNMRAPVIQVLGKPPHDYKGGSSNYSHYDHSHHTHNWEKRGVGRYHDDWEKRGSYSGSGGTGGVLRINEGTRNAIFLGDAGRPPGRIMDGDGVEGESSQNTGVGTPTPVILSRARSNSEQRSTSPNPTIITARKDSAPTVSPGSTSSNQQYQIASKPLMMEASLTPERVMKGPARLLDESLSLCDDLSPYLLDQSNFLVVAMMGMQGVGKSALASLFVDSSVDVQKIRSCMFRPESLEQIISGCHGTNGIDVYITNERLIVLDCQPLLSPSIMDRLITQEKKFTSDYNSTENLMEVESLQVLTLVMSIAHVVIMVQDSAADPNLIRLLQTCEMMKPSSSSTPSCSSSNASSPSVSEDTQQYFPHVVFVHNRAPPHHFTPATLKKLQGVYQEAFSGSCLESESRVGICNSLTYTPLAQTSCGSLVNLFLLPDFHNQHHSAVTFAEALSEMRRQLLSVRRLPLTHLTLTEKSWYQYVCRTWESVRKWSLFVEYSRLLP